MNALKLFNLLKQFHGYESNKKNEVKELEPKSKANGGKRHVRFINQKMVLPMLFLISLFAPRINFASNNQNMDGCTVIVSATTADVTIAGCNNGSISFTPQTSELFSYEIRPTFDLSILAASAGSDPTSFGTISNGGFMAATYQINIITESGSTGTATVNVNQPVCPIIPRFVSPMNPSLAGANDGACDFGATLMNSCNGTWSYKLYYMGAIVNQGEWTDPSPSPGLASVSFTGLNAGVYTIALFGGGLIDYPNACEYEAYFNLVDPPCDIAFTSTFTNPTASTCGNGSIHLDITGNTNSGYYVVDLYPQAGGLPTQYYVAEDANAGVFEIAGLSGGNYEVIVNNGVYDATCTAQAMIELTESACDLSINSLVTNNSTSAGCNNGMVDLNISGETCAEYYLVNVLNDGNNLGTYYPTETSATGTLNITGLSPGNYSIEVNNGGLFCTTTQTFTITEPACNITIADFAMNNPTVNLGNNGSVLFNAQGGSCDGSYYYELYESGSYLTAGYVTVVGASSPASIAGLSAGNFELKLFASYNSSCMASQLFSLNNMPCNLAINNLTATNIAANSCGNGALNFNISGSTAYGYYDMTIEKDGSYYSASFITPTGNSTPVSLTNLEAGSYTIFLTDGAPTPCTAQQSIAVTEATCDVLITNPVLTEISVTGYSDGAVTGTMTGATCSGTYLVKLFNSGNFVESQVVQATNPVFTFSNLMAGLYEIQAFSGENVGNTCFNEYGFILIDPCPVGNLSVEIDSTLGPCDYSTISISTSASTDPSKLYTIEVSYEGGPWLPTTGPYFGHPGLHTVQLLASADGHYDVRSGPLVVIDLCNLTTGFNLYKRYCDATFTSLTTVPATSGCENGRVDISFNDPTCAAFFRGTIFLNGDSIDVMDFGTSVGSNHLAYKVLPAGNYSYIIYTNTSIDDTDPQCPISGSFTIPNAGCNLTFSNEIINNGCNGTEYSAQINGITCHGQFLVELYKDGILIQSNATYANSNVGNIGYGFLSSGNYTVKVFTNHLNPGTCFAESNFTANAMSCDLSITNLVLTNAAADLSTFGSINFDVAGTECFGYQVILKKNGTVYFANNVTPTGPLTPVSFSSLPPDNYEIIFSNGFCEISQLFTITQGNLSCNINYTNLTTSNVTTNGGSNGTINFTLNGNTCVSGQYEIEVYRNSVLLQSANYTATGSSTSIGLSNLPAGNIQVLVYNGCTSGINECAITFASLLTEPPVCNLLVSVTNATIPGPGCSNGILTVNMQGNANGNDYVLNVTKDGNYVFSAGYPSGSAVTDVISNLSAGVYDLNLSYTGSGSCGSNTSYTLTNIPCNLSIDDVVVTSTTNNWNSGSIAFDVNGTICETSSLQLLNATGAVLVNSTISASEGRLFENLDVGSYSIQVTTPGGCSINYPFAIDAFCDITLFNETVTFEGAGSCTTGKITYYVDAPNNSNLYAKIINNIDLSVLYQTNVPYWDGININEINNIPVGNYTLQIIDLSSSCIANYNFTIDPAPCSNIEFTNVTLGVSTLGCAWAFGYDLNLGNCIGSALSLTKDGSLLNNYILNTSVSTEINALTIGNYNLHLATASGCNIDYPFVVNPTCNLAVNNPVVTQTSNNLNNGSIVFNLTGDICNNTPLQLLSSTGAVLTTQMIYQGGNYTFASLDEGNYSVQVTNSVGCSVNYPFAIDAFCDITLFNETVTFEGAGSCTTGKITYYVDAPNNSNLYAKIINNIDLSVLYQTNVPYWDGININEINNIPVGNYTLQIIDLLSSCIANYNFTIDPAPCSNIEFTNVTLGVSTLGCAWAFGYDLNLGNCPGSLLTLSKDGSVLNNYILNASVSTEINALTIGNYNLHLATASGCIIDYPFVVNPTCNLAVNNPIISPTVNGAGNGSILFNLNGDICANTPLQLLSNTGAILATQNINQGGNFSYSLLDEGNYSINVTNSLGCAVNYPFEIEVLCDITVFNQSVNLVSAGTCTQGTLSYFVNAPANSNLFVKVINNADLSVFYQSNVPNFDGIDANEINDIPIGNYTLQVYNLAGSCINSSNFSIEPAPCSNIQFSNITITASSTDGCNSNFGFDLNLGSCPGSVLTLYYGGLTYNTININQNLSTEIPDLFPGNYTYNLTTGGGCNIDYPFTITPNNCNITLSNSVITNTGVMSCSRGRIDFDVNGSTCGTGAVALIQNGTILNTINWTTGNGTGLYFSNLQPGNYSIVAVNNLLNVTCGDTITFNIPTNPCALSISNIATTSTGVLACTNGAVNFTVSGTTCQSGLVIITEINTPSTIIYSATFNNSGNQTFAYNGLPAGTYKITFGNFSCYIEETFTIAPNPCNLSINNVLVTPVSGSEGCTVASVSFTPMGDMCSNGFIQLMQNGTSIGTSILWNQNTAPNISFGNLSPGIYTLFVATYLPNFCMTSQDFEVFPTPCSLNIATVTSTPSSGSNGTINATGAGNYCGAVSFALDAEITAGNYNNITTNTGNIATQFTGLAPGNYRVTISSAGSSCQEVEYITVTGTACNTNPIISANSTTVCPGLPVILNSNYLTGNAWSNGGNSFNTQVTTAGTYTLTVTEPNGCTGSTSIIITNATTCVPATQMSNNVCGTLNYVRTSSVTCLPVSGATQYEWQFSNSSGVFATKITSTNYVLLHSVTPALNWGTNWNIKVRAKIGANVGPFSPDCAIGIIADPSINGVAQTQLRTEDCNKQNYRMNASNRIIANPITGAIQYEFEFSSAITGLVVATKLMNSNVLFLNTVTPALTFPAQYNVRVRARIGGTWGVFGNPCLIGIIGLNREEANIIEAAEIMVDEISMDTYFDMLVIPNPFNEQATLNIHSNNDEQVNIEVFDMVGNIVWKQLVLSNTNVNFGIELAQGTYIVKAISQKGNQAMFRFIKSK